MSIVCPYCSYKMNVKGLRPGRFTPKCPSCHDKFAVIVPEEESEGMTVLSLKVEGDSDETTASIIGLPSAESDSSPPRSHAASPDDTAISGITPAPNPSSDNNDNGDTVDSEVDNKADIDATISMPQKSHPTKATPPSPADDDTMPLASSHAKASTPASPDVTAPSGVASSESTDNSEKTDASFIHDNRGKSSSHPADGRKAGASADSPDVTAPSGVQSPDATAPSGIQPNEDPLRQSPDITAPSGINAANRTAPSSIADADVTIPSGVNTADRTAPSGISDRTIASGARSPDVTAPSGIAGSKSELPADVPSRLGGYEIIKVLGRGGMGSVLLARQVSLDRFVAVKVMNAEWASNAQFVSRFTREAYAAAQLVHHNVVQIYDIGEERRTNFFSMEFVEGQSIGDMVKKDGRFDTEEAVSYILQAARGLKFAHDNGMIHRDIKPDNLMLNKHKIVKVADLGLVKTPRSEGLDATFNADAEKAASHSTSSSSISTTASADITMANIAMGTPAYMPPEQADDAASVDGRADIYSLGCTLYVMVTGRPLFEGKTAMEVITKHKAEAVVPPDLIVDRVPKFLSTIIMKMVAKKADDRYQNMDEVIDALQQFLGVDSSGPFTPREEHARALEDAVVAYNTSRPAKTRRKAGIAFFALLLVAMLILGLTGKPVIAGAMIGLGLLSSLWYFVINGVRYKTYLFGKARSLAFGSSLADWAMGLVAFILLAVILVIFQQHWWWLGFTVAAAALAMAFHVTMDRKVANDRAPFVRSIEELLESMRMRGLEEQALRQFVCKYSGPRWEAFYEALFGYQAKIDARRRWGSSESGKQRKKFGAWRDPIIEWIDIKEKARKEAREKKHLKKIEKLALKANGLSEDDADAKANGAAEVMVAKAQLIQEQLARQAASIAAGGTLTVAGMSQQGWVAKPQVIMNVDDANETDEAKERARARDRDKPRGLANLVLGARARFIIGALLLAGCLMWLHQRGLLSAAELEGVKAAVQTGDGQTPTFDTDVARDTAISWWKRYQEPAEPLNLIMLPPAVCVYLSNITAGLAGLVLICSAFFRGAKMSMFILPAAALMIAGPQLLKLLFTQKAAENLGAKLMENNIGYELASLIAAGILIALGVVFGRRKRTSPLPTE